MRQGIQGTVLVLDGQFMSALAIARSLGQRGIRVILASTDSSPLAGRSRYVSAHHRYADPAEATDIFLDDIAAIIERYRPDLLIPVTEKTLIPISEQRDRFQALTSVALPPVDALITVLDKQATADLAASLSIPTPLSFLTSDEFSLQQASDQTGFPVVLKPIRSVSRQEGGIGPQLAVTYAFNAEELPRIAQPLLEHGEVVLQEYFQGEGIGIELIAEQGVVRYAFQHRRLHEMPLSGGGSSLRESVPISPRLLDAAKRLMSALNWHGVAMVEFKVEPVSGDFRLIEINGRFWGSLPLSIAAGADFPLLAWELYTQDELTLIGPARVGVRCRDLAKDIYWHEHVIRRLTDSRLFQYPTKTSVLLGLLGVFSPRHHFDSWSLRDPMPGLVELGRLWVHYYDRIANICSDKIALRQQQRAWKSGRLQKTLAGSQNILILCYGNINRSAAAHAYLQQRFKNKLEIKFYSAGFHLHEGRPADPNMVETGAQNGIDMSQWRSTALTKELLDQADIIFAMEVSQLARIATLSPDASNRSYLWGASLGTMGEPMEIADPYGKPIEEYKNCFGQLTRAADRMFETG